MIENAEAESSKRGVELWNDAVSTALKIPHVAIDRTEFLKRELSPYIGEGDLDKVESSRPWELVGDEVLEKIAKSCIRSATLHASAKSFVAGLPGGIGLVGTIPLDMLQYFYHTIRLSQKISYLYGFPNLVDEKGNISDSAVDLLSVYLGVNLGVNVAGQAIEVVVKQLSKTAPAKVAAKSLTKSFFYPLVKKMAPHLGVKMTKQLWGKGVGKVLPVLGGVLSGGLTAYSIHGGGKKLLEKMKGQKEIFMREDAKRLPAPAQVPEKAEVVVESDESAG